MMTPRSHARTRCTALLVIAAAGLMALAGCDPRTVLYFLQPFEPTVPAPGPKLKEKKVVVLAHALSSTQSDIQALDREIAREFANYLRKNVKKIEVVDIDKTWAWMEGHPNWTDPSEAAKAFEADIAIFLEIESFQVSSPSSPGMLEGLAKTHIQAFELAYPKNSKGKALTDQPKEAHNIYDAYKDSQFPVRGPIQEGSDRSRSAFRSTFVRIVATELAWHFVDHSPEDDIESSKIAGP